MASNEYPLQPRDMLHAYRRQEQGVRTLTGGVPQALMNSFRRFLRALSDSEVTVDSGEGLDEAHFWMVSDGVEYFISVRKSARQRSEEGCEVH